MHLNMPKFFFFFHSALFLNSSNCTKSVSSTSNILGSDSLSQVGLNWYTILIWLFVLFLIVLPTICSSVAFLQELLLAYLILYLSYANHISLQKYGKFFDIKKIQIKIIEHPPFSAICGCNLLCHYLWIITDSFYNGFHSIGRIFRSSIGSFRSCFCSNCGAFRGFL